jgi:hypothetical protein
MLLRGRRSRESCNQATRRGTVDAQKGMRLDPLHPGGYFFQIGWAYISLRQFNRAVVALKAADQNNPWTHGGLAHAFVELGREQEAKAEMVELMRVSPHFSVEQAKQRDPVNWDEPSNRRLLLDLRKLGLK